MVSVTDPTGTIQTTIDLLGRTVSYSDVYEHVTNSTYDTWGRLTQRQGPMGNEEFVYDTLNRLTTQKLYSTVLANVYYDSYSRIDHVDYPAAGTLGMSALGRDSLQTVNSLTWRFNGGSTVTDAVTRSQSGKVLTNTTTAGASTYNRSYTYDKASRLTGATLGANTYAYGFGTQNSFCGTGNNKNANSGKDSNRTSQTIDGVTTYFCYDFADKLISSSDALHNTPTYDAHGNMTQIGTGATPLHMYYDPTDRNTGFEQYTSAGNGVGLYYDRDATNRIIGRYLNDIVAWDWQYAGDFFYGYTAPGDSPDFLRDDNWDIVEKYLALPGGATLTIKPLEATQANKHTYSLQSLHGDSMLLANGLGANTSTGSGPANSFVYDPFGNAISTLPAQGGAAATLGWASVARKFTETALALRPIQMGARLYLPSLGRFTSVDPIEGGTLNNYVYALDPVNQSDFSGKCIDCIANAIYVFHAVALIAQKLAPKTTAAVTARVQSFVRGIFAPSKKASPTSTKKDPLALPPNVTKGLDRLGPQPSGTGGNSVLNWIKSLRWSWHEAISDAQDYSNAGKIAGGAIGCYGGAVLTLPTGGSGCIPGGPAGAAVGGGLGFALGFITGGFHIEDGLNLDGAPDSNIKFK